MIHLERVVNGMRIQGKDIRPNECEVCLQGKMTNDSGRTPVSVPRSLYTWCIQMWQMSHSQKLSFQLSKNCQKLSKIPCHSQKLPKSFFFS